MRRIINTPAYFFEQYQIIDMLDESGRKHHSDDEIEDFIQAVKKAYQSEQITSVQAKKNVTTFLNSQGKVQGGRIADCNFV